MARDYAEIEREFIAGLAAETGRGLGAWMAAIDAEGFSDKNDVIDWLRRQGLRFADASKLERIHANGGRPVYSNPPPTLTAEELSPRRDRASTAASGAPGRPADDSPSPLSPASAASYSDPSRDPALEPLLAAARGYRPLAILLVRELARTLPNAAFQVEGPLIIVRSTSGRAVAAIEPRPKEIRLSLALAGQAPEQRHMRGTPRGAPAHLDCTLILDDARRIDATLMALVEASAGTPPG